ncbi:hypothetical protein LINPERPRIM_LOCUS1462 [Linum perenne]
MTLVLRTSYVRSCWVPHPHPRDLLGIKLRFRGLRSSLTVYRLVLLQRSLLTMPERTHGF